MFDAGAIMAHLDVDLSLFDRKMSAAEARVKRFEDEGHKVKISAVFDNASLGRARQLFTQLDNQLSREAMQRLRSSPQGSVLGALNALFSPHPVTGGPSASQSAQGGLLGRIISAPGGGLPGHAGVSSILLGGGPAGTAGGIARIKLDPGTINDLANAINNGPGSAPAGPDPGTARMADDTRRTAVAAEQAAANSKDAAQASEAAARDSANSSRSLLSHFGFGGGGGGGGLLGSFFGSRGGASSGARAGLNAAGFAGSVAGGIGPGILGIGAKTAGIIGLGGSALGAVPALGAVAGALGVAGVGAGLASLAFKGANQSISPLTQLANQIQQEQAAGLGATAAGQKQLASQQKQLNAGLAGLTGAQQQLFNAEQGIQNWWQNFTASMTPMFAKALTQVAGLLTGTLAPLIKNVFGAAGGTLQPLIGGLGDLAKQVLPPLAAALRAVAPLIRPLIDGLGGALGGILRGLVPLLKAAGPAVSVFSGALAQLGTDIGKMFQIFAPVIKQSSVILGALLSVVDALFPIIGQLAAIFASALAPVFTQFAGVVKALLPFLTTVGHVLAALAGAVLGDLVSAFSALAQLLVGISPALNAFAKAFSQVFTVLENSGVFAIIGNALEALVKPLTVMINALLRGLTPLLPPIISFISQLSTALVTGLTQAIISLLPPLTQLAVEVLATLVKILPVILPLILRFAGVFTDAVVVAIQGVADALTAVLKIIPPSILGPIVVGVLALVGAFKLWGIIMESEKIASLVSAVISPVGLITLAVAGLIIGIVELVRHWNTVWGTVKSVAKDAWEFLTHGWGQIIIPQLTLIRLAVDFFRAHWRQVWTDIRNWAQDFWNWLHQTFGVDIGNFFTKTIPGWYDTLLSGFHGFWGNVKGGFSDLMHWFHQTFGTDIYNFFTQTVPNVFKTAVNKIGQFWTGIQGVIQAPVKWVFQHVLDPLASGFDWITSHLGLGHPIPTPLVQGFARGGKIPGFGGGDILPALLEPGETVVDKHSSRKDFMVAAFKAAGVPGYQAGGRAKQGQAPPFNIHTGTQTGGQTGGPLGGLLSGIENMAKISAALVTGNPTALINALSGFTGHKVPGAGGDMAGLMLQIPRLLVHDLGTWLFGKAGGGSGNAIVQDAMRWIGKVPYVWGGTSVPGGADCSGFVQTIYGRHGIVAPRTSEAQGAWVKRSGAVPGGLAFFNSPAGGPPPGHVAIVKDGSMVISQGGGMGPQLMPLTGALPLMWTGIPPGGFPGGAGGLPNIAAIGPLQTYARKLVDGMWGDAQWPPFADIVRRESNWDVFATNPNGGAYGIPQALPGSKMASAGADWRTDGYTQLRWMVGYIKGKWGTPANADFNEQLNHWYGKGGMIREPVIGFGQVTGDKYHFAENGPEWVTPMTGGGKPGTSAAIGNVFIQLPEGQTVARALTDLNFWLNVARQQGWAGGMPGA